MIDKNYLKDNIREVYDCVPLFDLIHNQNWYNEMHKWCKDFSLSIDMPIIPVIGTFAALSPQNSVKFNKIFTEAYYKGFEKHTKQCIDKCNRINAMYGYLVDDEETQVKQVMSYLNGRKITSFFHNILYPNTSPYITIDRWMLKVAGLTNSSITPKQYDLIQECYIDVANELNLLPLKLQSILWIYYRKSQNKNLMYD